MTLENCRKHLELAKTRGDTEEVKMLEERIKTKLAHPKYATEVKEKPKPVKKKVKEVKEDGG